MPSDTAATPPGTPQTLIPERGFSSVKEMPGGQGDALLVLRSEENAAAGSQETYVSVVGLDGRLRMPELLVPGHHKFEGIEVLA